jgi:hypothetical protein
MGSLLTAALGGSLVATLTATARAAGIPGDVRTHDLAIRTRDDQLATWVADRDYALGCECTDLRSRLGPCPAVLNDGAGGVSDWPYRLHRTDEAIAAARGLAIHEYRDQERLANIDVGQVIAGEGWPHRLYRRLRRRRVPQLVTPDRAVPVLNAWRKQSSMSERPVWPVDATQRTLDDAINGVRSLGP